MNRFLVLFVTLVVGLFVLELLEPVRQAVILPFTSLLADVSAAIMQRFDADVMATEQIIRSRATGFAVEILPGCNAVEALIILFAAIFAFPASLPHKLMGFVAGFFAVQLLNLVRIISLFYLGQWNMTAFEWFHKYLWQAFIMLDALIFWLLWLRYVDRRRGFTESPAG